MIMRFIELFCFSFKSFVFSDCFYVTGFSRHKPSRPSSGGVCHGFDTDPDTDPWRDT